MSTPTRINADYDPTTAEQRAAWARAQEWIASPAKAGANGRAEQRAAARIP